MQQLFKLILKKRLYLLILILVITCALFYSLLKLKNDNGDVRGLGLMLGAELIYSDGRPNPEAADEVLEKMKDLGVLVGKTGASRNVLTFMPPLVVQQGDIDRAFEDLQSVLRSISQ
ncbi:MAG: aminotransferase class III-fold pyridoxal phosphate-dependent enzyme [Nitrospira sp.]|nr:aminotransferase class III-fold pyridoxal phosphate-dependent enzyme [bacterium]MBL7049131.1 aminotransferase class III-fold pyridoxal phosphate-dependent enzyme [Nitrospira sp.]